MATYSSALTDHYYLKLEVTEQSYSVANNTSTLAWRLYVQSSGNGYYFSTIKIGAKVTIDGTVVLNRAYSSSSQYSCAAGGTVDVASGMTTIPHNSDGTKTIAAGAISASNTTQTGAYCPNMSLASGSALTLTAIPRASTISLSTNSTVMGVARTITISRASSSFTHTLTYSFGSASGQIGSAKTSATSVSFTPPASLASQLSNAKSGTGTITCETFNGNTSVGTSSISFTATIPVSTVSPNSSTVTMGSILGFTITRAAANLTHTLAYTFGSASGTVGTSLGTSASWTTAKALASEVAANNASGSGTVTLTTYNGTATVGTSTASFTLKIPASSFTIANATQTMGENQSFTISRAASNITHRMTYSFNGTSGAIGTGIGTSKTWTVPTSLASQLSNAKQGTCTVTMTTLNGTAVCGTPYSKTFTAAAPVSTMTLSSSSVYVGTGSTTVTINRAATNMTHTLEYKFSSDADSTYASIGSSLTTTATWSPAYSLASKIPSATSGSWTLRLTTYIGSTEVGKSAKTLTLKVPNNSTTQPTLTSSTLSPSSSLSSPFNTIFIANYTKLRAVISASGKYSATISTYAVTVDGVTKSGSSSTQTTAGELTTSGTVTVTTKVTDSRGFTKSSSQNITVYEYNEPSVVPKTGNTKIVCGRSNSSGTLQNNGTFVHIEAGRTISSLNSNNKGKLTWEVFDSSGASLGTGTVVANQTGGTATNAITTSELVTDLTSTYSVILTATDDFGNSSTYRATIPTDSVTLHLRRYGSGVGIGMYSQGQYRVDVAWDSWFNGRVLPGQLSSLVSSDSSVRSNIILPGRHLASDIMGAADSFPYNAYLEAWLKRICVDHPGATTTTAFFGTATPGSGGAGVIACEIDSTGDLSGGLPNNSSGYFIPRQNSAVIRFGTTGYSFWYRVIYANDPEDGTLTYTNNSLISEAQFGNIGLKKSGKVVTLSTTSGITPSSTSGGTSYTTIGTLPSGFYPQTQTEVPIVLRSTTYYSAFIQVTTAGNIRLYKNNTSTNILNFAMSWITA